MVKQADTPDLFKSQLKLLMSTQLIFIVGIYSVYEVWKLFYEQWIERDIE